MSDSLESESTLGNANGQREALAGCDNQPDTIANLVKRAKHVKLFSQGVRQCELTQMKGHRSGVL